MKKYLLLLPAVLLAACMASGPQKSLDELATAMEKTDAQTFLSYLDMPAFAANDIRNMTENDNALNSINAIGKMFGLGNINDLVGSLGLGDLNELIGNVVDMQKRLSEKFTIGISSGELMADCSHATTPNCPWVPRSLRDATVVELGPEAAIAKITTPARITSWLALRKIGNKWLVVGQAVLESTARSYATSSTQGNQGPKQNADDSARI